MTVDQTIALFASIGACASAVATLLTVRQIAKQREASFRPELVVPRVIISCRATDSSGIPHYWSAEDSFSAGDKPKSQFKLPIRNIGFGAAKNVVLTWKFDLEAAVKLVNDLAQRSLAASHFSIENEALMFETSNGNAQASFWKNQRSTTLDHVLPVSYRADGEYVVLPHAYIFVVSALFYYALKLGQQTYDQMPQLFLEVCCSDIGEIEHRTRFRIDFTFVSGRHHPDRLEMEAILETKKL
jgi:hypothetical protein